MPDSVGAERAKSFGSLKKRKLDATANNAPPGVEEIKSFAKVIYDWIKLGERSNYRMPQNFRSAGGVFYAFQAADKTTRAWVETKHINEGKLDAIAFARRREAAPVRAAGVKKEEEAGDLSAE